MLQLNNVMDLKEKRKLAKDVLEDNMSESTSEHINKVDYLTNWIIDAMIEFSDKVNNGVLDDVIVIHLKALTKKIEDSHCYGFEDVLNEYLDSL